MRKNLLHSVLLVVLTCTCAIANPQIEELHQRAYTLLDDHLDSAFELASKAEGLSIIEKKPFLQAQSLFIQAYILRVRNKMGQSFITNMDALKILENLKSEQAISTNLKILLNTGEILTHHYAFDHAIQYYNRGIEIAKTQNNYQRLVKFYFNKAIAQRSNNYPENALESINRAHDVALILENELKIIQCLNIKGLILVDLGQFEESRKLFTQIVEFDYKTTEPNGHLSSAWHNIGHSYATEGLPLLARTAYMQALSIPEDNNQDLFLTYLDLTEINFLLEDYDQADYFGERAEVLYDQIELEPNNYKLFDIRSKVALKLQKNAAAFEYVQRYYQENMSFLQIQSELLKTRSQYNMEVLTAGFFNPNQSNSQDSLMEYVLWLAGVCIFGLIFLFKIKSWYLKRELTRELRQIDQESIV